MRQRKVLSLEAQVVLFRRLEAMFGSGVPVHLALNHLVHDEDEGLAEALEVVRSSVVSGRGLGESMKLAGVFPPVVYYLVKAGEESGSLDLVLGNLASTLEYQFALKKKIMGAFLYPAALMVLTAVIVAFMALVILPREREMFAQMGAELPLLTVVVMKSAEIAASPLFIGLLLLTGGLCAYGWAWKGESLFREHAAATVDRFTLKLPILGSLVHKICTARMLSVLGPMLEAGMSLGVPNPALRKTLGNRELERRFSEFQNQIRDGSGLREAAESAGPFPALLTAMLGVAEEHGNLARVMNRCRDVFEFEVDHSLKTVASLLEPLALVIMGLVVGIVVLATMLPNLALMQSI